MLNNVHYWKVVEELEDAFQRTNRAFQLRILETKKAKTKLENLESEVFSYYSLNKLNFEHNLLSYKIIFIE